LEALPAVPRRHGHDDGQSSAPLATQAQAIDAPGVQVMPVRVARIDQPLATSWTCREQAKTVSGEIPDQLVAELR
jgi:hypothetical protein